MNKPFERVTIYAPDGTPHTVAPVDAREILASGSGYTATPPAQVSNEQQSEQQSIVGDASATEAPTAEVAEQPDNSSNTDAKPKRASRKK